MSDHDAATKFYTDGEPDIDKELDWLIEKEEKAEKEESAGDNMDNATEEEIDKLLAEDEEKEKGQSETAGTDKEEDGSGEPAPAAEQNESPNPEPVSGESGAEANSSEMDNGPTRSEVVTSPGAEEDEYTLTDDQRQAMIELENMKGDSDYDYLPDEDPPEYDVRDRIKQLNAELETDGVPLDKERETKVNFKDNLVDLVAPPPVFSDDEEEVEKNPEQSEETESASENQDTQSKTKENKVLIEREGKFELVDSDDPLAQEYGGGPPLAAGAQDSSLAPSPPSQPRPATANGYNRQQRYQPNRRAQSAQVSSRDQEDEWNSGYKSPYGLSDAQKTIKAERDKALLRRQRAEAERKQEEEEKKQEENNEAFEAWLRRKQEDAVRRRQEEKERKNQQKDGNSDSSEASSNASANSTETDRDSEGAFKEWLQVKAKQKETQKEMEHQQMKELQDGYYVRTRRDCDKAYKAWLKKKNADQKNGKDAKRKKQSVTMLYLRRSRKSQALARAIQYSQSFRYVDYYGYRM